MKRFIASFTISLCAGLLLIAVFIVLADPFYHYHAPIKGEAYMDNALYQTPGAAVNLEYDSVIVGSSMTENFRESWFKEMGLNLQKLSYSGAEIADYEKIYETVFNSGNKIELVITDINGFQLMSAVDAVYHEYPEYLYDGITFSDVQYIYNNDVFWEAAGRVVEELFFDQLKKDDSYTWENPDLFSEVRARTDYDVFKERLDNAISEGNYNKISDEERMTIAKGNVDRLLENVRKHEDVTFVFYFPAYSKLYWEEVTDEDDLDIMLEIYGFAMRRLLECDNAVVFDFQDDFELVNDLRRYRDVSHHDPQGNRFVYECIRDTLNRSGEHMDEFRVSEENIQQHLKRIRENVVKEALP